MLFRPSGLVAAAGPTPADADLPTSFELEALLEPHTIILSTSTNLIAFRLARSIRLRAVDLACHAALARIPRHDPPPDQAVAGNKLQVEYFGERYAVTVDVVGSTPLFDPDNERVRC